MCCDFVNKITHLGCVVSVVDGECTPHRVERSLAMENDPDDWRGYFMASAFYLVGHKAT